MDGFQIDRRAMKLDARDAMRTHKPSVYLVAIVFLIIALVLDALSTKLQFPGLKLSEILQYSYNEKQYMQLMYAASRRGFSSRMLELVISIMSGMVNGGFALFCLYAAQRREAGVGTLFDLFAYFFRFLWLGIVMGFFIFLWTLLFVIPGIIAAYRYSMAMFIFFEHPEKGAMQCIRESKEMTQGYKGQLFVLDLSFLGWLLLSVIPFVSIFTLPYIGITKANYYRVLSGQMNGQETQQRYYSEPWNQ